MRHYFNRSMDKLEAIFLENNSSASIPLTLSGEPLLSNIEEVFRQGNYMGQSETTLNRVIEAAKGSYAISSGRSELYTSMPPLRRAEPPDISHFTFCINTEKMPTDQFATPMINSQAQTILYLKTLAHLAEKRIEGQVLHSPIFLDTSNFDSQLEISWFVADILLTLLHEIQEFESGNKNSELIVFLSSDGIVINSVTRAHLLPLSIPVSATRLDFDSGNCDILSNTSFRFGDRVRIAAQFLNYTFVVGIGAMGWVNSDNIKQIDPSSIEQDEKFICSSCPRFVKIDGIPRVTLPGDSLLPGIPSFPKEHNTTNFIGAGSVPNLLIVHNLRSPQDFVTFLYHLTVPYLYSIFDCSEVIRRAFAMVGIYVPKYSGDMIQALSETVEISLDIDQLNSDDLQTLTSGLYIAELLDAPNNDLHSSLHLYMLIVTDNTFETYSYAFSTLGDDGITEFPVGPHICGIKALQHQLKKGRTLQVARIACPSK